MALVVDSIQTLGTHGGPGIRLVVFLRDITHDNIHERVISTDEIISRLKREKKYLRHGGLTVSGARPLQQRHELINLFKEARKEHIHTTLDTMGSILDDATKELLKHTDLVLLDITHRNFENYAIPFANYLEEIDKPFWLRYVLFPESEDHLQSTLTFADHFTKLSQLQRVEILPYHTLGAYKYRILCADSYPEHPSATDPAIIQEAKKIFKQHFSDVVSR